MTVITDVCDAGTGTCGDVGCPGGVGAPDDDYMLGPTINNITIEPSQYKEQYGAS